MNHEIIKSAIDCIRKYEQGSEEYRLGAYVLSHEMHKIHLTQLTHLVNHSPIRAVKIADESVAMDLLSWGLAVRICVEGSNEYIAATRAGYDVMKMLEDR